MRYEIATGIMLATANISLFLLGILAFKIAEDNAAKFIGAGLIGLAVFCIYQTSTQ